jgi:VanZ family protein
LKLGSRKLETEMVARRISRYLPLLLWMGFISLASTSEFSGESTSRIVRPLVLWFFPNTSEETVALIHFIVRKVAHFAEYAVMGFLAARAFTTSSHDLINSRWFVLAFVLIAVYALLDEYHQGYVPSRTASVYDSMIDTAGGLVALLAYKRWRKNSIRTHSQ